MVRAVERVQPSVVSIHVLHRETVYYRDPFLQHFLGPHSSLNRLYAAERDRISGGSGVVVDPYRILTNAHVLGNLKAVRKIKIFLRKC